MVKRKESKAIWGSVRVNGIGRVAACLDEDGSYTRMSQDTDKWNGVLNCSWEEIQSFKAGDAAPTRIYKDGK